MPARKPRPVLRQPPLHTLLLISGPLPAKAPVPPFEVWGPTASSITGGGMGAVAAPTTKQTQRPQRNREALALSAPPHLVDGAWGRAPGLRSQPPRSPHTQPGLQRGAGQRLRGGTARQDGQTEWGSPSSDTPAPPSQPSWPPGPHLPPPIESCFHHSSQVTRSPGLGDILLNPQRPPGASQGFSVQSDLGTSEVSGRLPRSWHPPPPAP